MRTAVQTAARPCTRGLHALPSVSSSAATLPAVAVVELQR